MIGRWFAICETQKEKNSGFLQTAIQQVNQASGAASAPRLCGECTGGLTPPRSPVSFVAARGGHPKVDQYRNDVWM